MYMHTSPLFLLNGTCINMTVGPLPDYNQICETGGQARKHTQRRQDADNEVGYNAVTHVAVYMLLMSFSWKGINMFKR